MQMMLSITGWSLIYSVLGVLLRNNVLQFFKFVNDFPKILLPLTLSPLCGIFGQIFIYTMLEDFGALPVSITTTVRKALTLVLVVIMFPAGEQKFVVWNWLGAVLMFGAILADTICRSDKMRNGIVSVMTRMKSDRKS
jgi:UAA transporter family